MGNRRKAARRRFWRITGILWIMLAAALCCIISTEKIPSRDSLVSITGAFRSIDTVLNGKSGIHWNIALEDGTVLKASRTVGFDPDGFKSKVKKGDLLGFGVKDGWIWEIYDESDLPIHSPGRSREAYMMIRDAEIWMIIIFSAAGVLCVLYGFGGRRRFAGKRRGG